MSFTLYTNQPSFRAQKALIAAAYCNLPSIKVVEVDLESKAHPNVLDQNPFDKLPLLETPQGTVFEANAIARFIARTSNEAALTGKNLYESSQVDQWLDAVSNELETHTWILFFHTVGTNNIDKNQVAEAKKEIHSFLAVVDQYLLTRTFLVGHTITLADIALTTALAHVYQHIMGQEIASKYVNLNRWFLTCVNQPNFAKVLGKVEVGDGSNKGGHHQQQQQQQKKENKKEEKKPAKEEKPAKEKKPAKEENEQEEEDFSEKRGANPLDALPRSSMIMDAVKKGFYEKKKNNQPFFPDFWQNFDANGYCMYFLDYNFNEENNVYFMTCNLVEGYFQRLEDLRKYGFGVLNVTGQDEDTKPFNVNGCFLFRGLEPPAEMRDCPDTEYYKLTPVNISDAAQRKQVEDAFLGESYLGLPVLERKYFK